MRPPVKRAQALLGDKIPASKEVYKVSRVFRNRQGRFGTLPCLVCGGPVRESRVRRVSIRWRGSRWAGKNERLLHASHFEAVP